MKQHQQINDILALASHEELKAFIRQYATVNATFYNEMITHFVKLSPTSARQRYPDMIRNIVDTVAGNDNFIGWGDTGILVRALDNILTHAEYCLENEDYAHALPIYTALLEEMVDTLQRCDDSNGDVGGVIDFAYEGLFDIAESRAEPRVKRALWQYCCDRFEHGTFEGWDWHIGMLEIASLLVENDEDVSVLITLLNTVKRGYDKERAEKILLSLYETHKSDAETKAFINTHINNAKIRESEIDKAIANADYERAITLCEDGIKYDEKERPGLVKYWYDGLLSVALHQNDTEKIIAYARMRFMDDFHPQHDNYALLKAYVPPRDWEVFVTQMVNEIMASQRWGAENLIEKIYVDEGWLEKLLQFIRQKPTLERIKKNESYLANDYAPELIALYRKAIIPFVAQSNTRKKYRNACYYLTRMQALGGKTEVAELVQYFKNTYPRRKAMIDELKMFESR